MMLSFVIFCDGNFTPSGCSGRPARGDYFCQDSGAIKDFSTILGRYHYDVLSFKSYMMHQITDFHPTFKFKIIHINSHDQPK